MRQRFSRLNNSFTGKLKRHFHKSGSKGGRSSSATSGTLALSSPPSLRSGNERSQTVQPPTVQPPTAQPEEVLPQDAQSREVQAQAVQAQAVRPQEAQPDEVHPQDVQAHEVQLPDASEMDATLIHTESDPWALAFSVVQNREGKLMLDYERYLSSLQGDTAVNASLSVPEFIRAIVHRAIDDREKKRWRVSLLGTDIEVRKQAERLAKLLLWSDPIVKSAVSSQPYAALAWSGVSILLPLVTSSITQNEAMLKGFNSIGDVQMYWRICEETHLPSLDGPSRKRFIEPLSKLYSYIVEYQARVICHLSKGHLTRAWSDVTSPGEWEAKIQEIDRLNQECRNVLQLFNADQIESKWNKLLSMIQESRHLNDQIHNALLESRLETQKAYKDEKATELLHLLASDYQGNKDFNPPKVEGTCEWFFADERFRNWRDSEDSRLLWVSAGPGCGKSVLSRALIDERRLSTNVTTSTLCYFFFKDGDESRMYAHNALCAILHQLFSQDFTGNLIEQALPSYKNFGKALTTSFSKLWEIFLRCSSTADCGEIICLIDALDECQEESRKMLIDGIKGLYQHSSKRPSRLQFLVTSRPYDDIELSFRRLSDTATYLRFDGDDKSGEIGHEINLVIDARVSEFAHDFEEEDRRLIADRLKSMGNRTYLWLYLTIDIIKRSPSEYSRPVDVETLLSSIPSEISEAYEKILGRRKTSRYTEALLRILLAAARPLSLEEANYALTLATAKEPFDSNQALDKALWQLETFKDRVQNLCGLFVSVHDGKLFLFHQTARDFLLSSISGGNWQGRFTMPKSHSTLSLACLRYLHVLLPDLPALQTHIYYFGKTLIYKFLSYAATYWPLHYKSQDAANASLSWEEARTVCCERHLWMSHYFPYWKLLVERYETWSDLSMASYLGLKPVVQGLLRGTADNDMSDADISQALCRASQKGHKEIVQMLLDHGADVDAITDTGTALLAASGKGYTEIVQMLLDHGADVSAIAGEYGTALLAASSQGHTETIQVLLSHGADVNAIAGDYGTALIVASNRGCTEAVQVLLDHGADVSAIAGLYGTALQAASYSGSIDTVRMLLDHGADVSAIAGEYGTALKRASEEGHAEIVQMLLDHGALVSAISGSYDNVLDAASYSGSIDTIRMLLDYGAGIFTHDHLEDAMQRASKSGYTEIVQLLREKKEATGMGRV
ncbi:hypothetical protein V8C26DRAFT_384656 [Trichoderma gracile]